MTENEERPVVFDGMSGEPVAWHRAGDPVIDKSFDPISWTYTDFTRRLTCAEAVQKYGPVTRLTVGTGTGFESVTFGETTFVVRWLDPRPKYAGTDMIDGRGVQRWEGGVPFDEACIKVHDPVTDCYACPTCGAEKGVHCKNVKTRHRGR